MTLVIRVTNPPVCGQLLSRITSTLRREDLEVVCANFAEEVLVNLADVLFQLIELDERCVIAFRTAMFQQTIEGLLNVKIGESDAVLLLIQT